MRNCCLALTLRPAAGIRSTLIAALLLSSVTSLQAQGGPASRGAGRSVRAFEQTVDQGILLLDGEFIQPPYQVHAEADRVTVNGHVLFELAKVESRDDHDESDPDFRRRRRFSGLGDFNGPGYFDDDPDGDYENPRSARRAAEGIVETLEEASVVVAFTGKRFWLIRSGAEVFTFCEVLLADEPSPEQVKEFLRLCGQESERETWGTLLAVPEPRGEFRARLQSRHDEILNTELAGIARHNALTRMEAFSYPLTLAGMLVGVIALGHVLKWTAKSIVAEQREDYAPEVTRCVEIALMLMLVMSAIDLTWTILAGQAGVMREVNPLAAGYLQSPLHLIVLKVLATGLGCGILYAWRRRRQVQNATWWMCLVCVLMTFRWVVFDSVIS